ncbi:cyclic peptide export ABC transporter [Chroococcidiopsis sp.]|uniref:cyclic peptide export ABC transporter n=1 Tax=Chroococcidiopsis sp. TaxID=3088168 RepID=UPI003F33D327
MNLIQFLLTSSWLTVAIAALVGSLGGASNAALLALINNTINSNNLAINNQFLNFILLIFIALLSSTISHYLLVRITQSAIYKLRLHLSDRILACPLCHLEELGANRLLATLTDDVDSISDTVFVVPYLCVDIALIIGCLIYLCWLSWQVFLVTALFISIALLVIKFLIAKAENLMGLARAEKDQLFKHFRTITDGIKELKLHAPRRRAFVSEELKVTAATWRSHNITSEVFFGISYNISQLFFFIIIGLILFGLRQFATVNTAILSGYVLVLIYLMDSLERVMTALPRLTEASIALRRIEQLGLSLASRAEDTSTIELRSPLFSQSIELLQVTHSYYKGEDENSFTVGAIDLTFYPGELIFIVGGNGSGKSTLAKLITGLYIPDSGKIIWDKNNVIEQNREIYRQLFSTVFSDFYLFEQLLGIQLDNLDERARKYLLQLQLEHKVKIKNNAFSTIELSQGQQKRLALLIAYLEDRPIYLFDEWAADQDPYFREIFYKQLLPELKQRGKTVIVITHDDRYFHLCDRLFKLDYGKLV